MEEDEKRVAIGSDDYNKDVLITQLKSIVAYFENADDILESLEDKPFALSNRTVLQYPRVLDIEVRLKLKNLED